MIVYPVIIFILTSLSFSQSRKIPSPPRIVKQPPTGEVLFQDGTGSDEKYKPFYIECEAIGEPTPKYRWIKNGKHFDWQAYDGHISQQSGRGTLFITKPVNDDKGQYQCLAENEWGTAISNSVFIGKAELNSFKHTQPLPLTGHEGEPFKLSCQPPDGWPKPKVYWMIQYTTGGLKSIDNSRMTLDPEGSLWFSNLTRDDGSNNFMYVCATTSVTKLEYKLGNQVLLNVLASGISPSQNKHKPVPQYVSRRNEVALRGKQVELFCIFGGTPLPQTVWSKNGKHIQLSDRVTHGNYGKSLVIKLVDFDDEGSYTCEISNGVGEVQSYSINLKVLAVPYFTVEPEFATAAEGESVEFRCAASGVPEPQIKWIHNGKPIAEAPPNPRRKVGSNNIIIEQVSKEDTGNYGCNATNSLGYIYKDVYINVLALTPEIVEAPTYLEAVDRKDINMPCKVFGAPKPEVKWIHNGKALTGGRYRVLASGDLHINGVEFGDAGEYICYAENRFGHANASYKFVVREHTEIRDGPEDYEVEANTEAVFRCNALHDKNLELEITWLKNGQEIDYIGEPRFVKSSDYSLTVAKTHELDSGTYTCVAKTRLDQAEASATLTVQYVPNPPQMRGILCNRKDATISWMPMGDNRAPILRYIIEYNTSFTPNKWEVMYDQVSPAAMSYNVPMSPWANYTFRIIAWNRIGPSESSGHSYVCTTAPEVPHKNPDNVEGRGTQPDNIVISWTPMPQIEHNAPNFHYTVYWKPDIPSASYVSQDINNWEQSSIVVITDQPAFTRYRIKVTAVNEIGEANVTPKDVIGYSGEKEPVMAPGNFTLIQIQSPTIALLSWNSVPRDSIRGHFRGYKIKTWTENVHGNPEIIVQGDTTKALVNNFVPYSKNYAHVYVYNDKYNGPPSETLNFDMPDGAVAPEIVEAPTDLEAVDGKDINMTCKVYGVPKPKVQWIHNGKALTGERYRVLASGDLHINGVEFGDAGEYICYAENRFGHVNASYKFIVREHTEIKDGPEDYEVKAKTEAVFRCNALHDKNLDLEIIWLINGQEIDYIGEPRFVKSSDYSLTVAKTHGLDSGTYTCVAKTRLDQAEASAILIVQDVPNPPQMRGIHCNRKHATIYWMPMGDNRAPILRYNIEYKTSFTSNKWEIMYDQVSPAAMSYNVPMSPWANYTFRIIAWNRIGPSESSGHSYVCTTAPEVPHKNPDNVEGRGTQPDNIVISWTPMPQIEHNAPNFHYTVYWKPDIPSASYVSQDINNWEQSSIVVITDQPAFTQYHIKVTAVNEIGEANVTPKDVIGYSGENEPIMAPGNFTLIQIQSPTTALLSWSSVPRESIRGHFRGYKIKIWTENVYGNREIIVQGDATKALVNHFVPYSKNYAQVYVYNDKYNGPPSETVSFDIKEGGNDY